MSVPSNLPNNSQSNPNNIIQNELAYLAQCVGGASRNTEFLPFDMTIQKEEQFRKNIQRKAPSSAQKVKKVAGRIL